MTNGALGDDAAHSTVAPRSLWANRPYQFLMWGNTTAAVGLSLAMFAVPLVAYSVTHSILLSGLVTAAGEIGALIALLPSGVLADRADRRMLLIWSAAAGLVIWGLLSVAEALHALNGWEIAAALLVGTVFTTIFEAAESAAIRVVVPPRQMPTAMAVNQGRQATASLAGAPVGGVLYALGAIWPLASGAVANGVSLITALFIRTSLGPEPSLARTHPLADLREGFRFVWSVPFRRFMLFFGAFINFSLIGVATAVNLHLVATGTLPVLIGLVDVAVGVGMLIGSFAASPIIQRVPAGPLGISAFIALVVGTAGVAAAPDVWWYLPALFVMGFAIAVVNSAFGGYNAVITPKRIMGRAGMIGRLGSTIIGPISPVVGAWLLDWLGMHITGIVFTVWLALFVAITAVNPALRRIGKPDTWESDAERMAAEHPEFDEL